MIGLLITEAAAVVALGLLLACNGHYLTVSALLALAGTITLIHEVSLWAK